MNLKNKISQVIQNKVNNKEMFTALDICMISNAKGDSARYSETINIVREIMSNVVGTNYISSLMSIPHGAMPVNLYYPKGSNPHDYDHNLIRKTLIQNKSKQKQDEKNTQTTIVTGKNDRIIKVGKNKRVRLPVEIVRELGLSPGDRAYVTFSRLNKQITVMTELKLNCYIYTVDKYGNLLIGTHNCGADSFQVSKETHIILTPIFE